MNGSKLYAPRATGYRPVSKKLLDNVVLPAKITCRLCNRSRTATIGFSKKQLDAFKNGIATRQITHATEADPCWIICTNCTGKQRTEMFCTQCQHWLGLDGFTKVQRRNSDNATCKQCVYENQTAAPMIGSGEDTLRHLSDDEDDTDSEDLKTTSFDPSEADGSEAGVRLPISPSQRLNEENLQAASSTAGGVRAWQNYTDKGKAIGRKYTAYSPEGQAYTKFQTQSVADSEDAYYAKKRASRNTERDMKELTSKFAKQKGPRQELPAPAPYVGGRAAHDDGHDADADSDDSYGYI